MAKRLLFLALAFLVTCLKSTALTATGVSGNYLSVKGMTFEGDIQGMATMTLVFNSDNDEGKMTMLVLGQTQNAPFTYEQNDNKIIVHAKNGDLNMTISEDGNITTVMNGLGVTLHPKTVLADENKALNVANHTFTGNIGTGTLRLRFTNDNTVNVLLKNGQKTQNEVWPYRQEGAKVIMTENMGRSITLTINGNNELYGMFTIVNVRLHLVE